MTSTLTPSQLFDLFKFDDAHYMRTSATYRDDLAHTLHDAFADDLATMTASYLRDMRDDEPIACTCFDNLEPNDTPICYCQNLYDMTRELTDDDYDALIALICAYYSDILAS